MSLDPNRPDLRNALLQRCFEERIEDVNQAEAYFTSQDLAALGFPNMGGTSNRGSPAPLSSDYQSTLNALKHAWEGLLLDFRKRIEQGQLHLLGVQTRPQLQLEESLIPPQWAADYRFDVLNGTLAVGSTYRFVRVVAIDGPPQKPPTNQPVQEQALTVLRPEDLPSLGDDMVLLLLEEHAKRVVASPDAKLIAPGKISLMPIIRRKMLHRAEQKQTRETLAAEASELADWIASKVQSHPTPSAGTIKNTLRKEYRGLKA